MNNTNETTSRTNAQNDIVVLGTASIETKGGGGELKEPMGRIVGFGISNE